MTDRVTLPELASALRRDLDEMRHRLAESGGSGILVLDSAEIELTVAIEDNRSVEGGVQFSVLGVGASVGAGGGTKDTATHKLSLKLKPKEGGVEIAGKE